MAISDRLNKLTTDITNAYTSIENKGGTIPANKNTNNLSTAIDSIQSSNIIGATAEGEILNLTNTKAMPYSDYVVEGKSEQEGEPSPSNPSEIHSVADDVNLFDEEKISRTVGNFTFSYSNKKIKLTGTANSTYFGTNNISQNIKAGTYTFSSTNTNSNLTYNMWLYNSSNQLIGNTKANNPVTISEDATYYVLFVEGLTNGTTYNEEVNVKLQKGTTSTPYSPYNQGTVTIKQRGKNLFDYDYAKEYSNTTVSSYRFVKIADVEINQNYTIGNLDTSDIENENGLYIIITNYPDYNSGIVNGNSLCSNSNKLTSSFKTINVPKLSNSLYIGVYPNTINETQWTKILDKFKNAMLVKGQYTEQTLPPYEPYQGYDKVFQTEPLRSLPNEVKDSLEDDGIHRRVGRVVLDGSENWTNKNITDNNILFSTNKIDNLFNTTNLTNLTSNYFNVNSSLWTNDNEGVCLFNMSASLRFRINKNLLNNISTVENAINSMKTWLSTHNTEVLYPLAEEIIEPLTQNQATTMLDIIKTGSYEGTTNIYTDEDVKPTIGVGYYKKG